MPQIKPTLKLTLALILLSLLYGYQLVLALGPFSFHEWRQADCLSFTLNYYKENLGFLSPSFNWLGNDRHGRTASEFPLIYYSVAQLWKLFGQHEYIFRLVNIIFVFSGLIYLHKLMRQYLENNFWAMTSVLFLFTSPILVYYANNFLADAPAFGMVLIGSYHLWRYYSSRTMKYLYFACFFFLLGGLLKISALLLFMGVLPIHLYLVVFDRKHGFKWKSLIPFALTILFTLVWNAWTYHYNKINMGYFLQGILPIWELSFSERRDISRLLFNFIMPSYFSKTALLMMFFMFLYSVLNWRRANRFLVSLNVICLFGSILFLVLFYRVFNVHDYYLVNLLVMIPLTVLTFLDLVKRTNPDWFNVKPVKVLAIIGMVMLVYNTMSITRIKYRWDDYFVSRTFLLDKPTIEYYGWYHWNYTNTREALGEVKPYLRKLGIQRTDTVISFPDETPNLSLYQMDLKGYTEFGFGGDHTDASIQRCIAGGAKYLIIHEKRMYDMPFLAPYIKHKLGTYRNVDIYSLAEFRK